MTRLVPMHLVAVGPPFLGETYMNKEERVALAQKVVASPP